MKITRKRFFYLAAGALLGSHVRTKSTLARAIDSARVDLDRIAPWEMVYGSTRKGGTVIYLDEFESPAEVALLA